MYSQTNNYVQSWKKISNNAYLFPTYANSTLNCLKVIGHDCVFQSPQQLYENIWPIYGKMYSLFRENETLRITKQQIEFPVFYIVCVHTWCELRLYSLVYCNSIFWIVIHTHYIQLLLVIAILQHPIISLISSSSSREFAPCR